MTIPEIFSENLRYQLLRKGASNLEFAEFMGVAPASVTDWIKGRKSPRLSKLDRICEFFGVGIAEMMTERGRRGR